MAKRFTNALLAGALGVNLRTLQRRFAVGMPKPKGGEQLEAWAERARTWQQENRQRTGPKPFTRIGSDAALQDADRRFRLSRAKRNELEIAELEGRLHSKEQCVELQVQQYLEVKAALMQLGPGLAPHLQNKADPEEIASLITEGVLAALRNLCD